MPNLSKIGEVVDWKAIRLKPGNVVPWCEMHVQLTPVDVHNDSCGRLFPGDHSVKGFRLSITASLGNMQHQGSESYKCVDGVTRRMGGGGCCHDTIAEFFPEAVPHIKYHLNDMRAGCKHQQDWDLSKKIEVTDYTWGEVFHKLRLRAESGQLDTEEYEHYKKVVVIVYSATIGGNKVPTPKHPSLLNEDQQKALADGLIKVSKVEMKPAGWVNPEEHPEGLLSKECKTCGYRYGTSWLYEPLPATTLEWARAGKA